MRGSNMTTHYLDLRVVPDAETTASQLLGVLFTKLHHALVQVNADDIGVSFPQYSRAPRGLGSVLRLHGSEFALKALMQKDWLTGIRDHVRMTDVTLVPADAGCCKVARRQFKTSAERLRRRRMKRKGESADEVIEAIPETVERSPDLPYLHLRSASTGQTFCLFVEQVQHQKPVSGQFTSYGLSQSATVPAF